MRATRCTAPSGRSTRLLGGWRRLGGCIGKVGCWVVRPSATTARAELSNPPTHPPTMVVQLLAYAQHMCAPPGCVAGTGGWVAVLPSPIGPVITTPAHLFLPSLPPQRTSFLSFSFFQQERNGKSGATISKGLTLTTCTRCKVVRIRCNKPIKRMTCARCRVVDTGGWGEVATVGVDRWVTGCHFNEASLCSTVHGC